MPAKISGRQSRLAGQCSSTPRVKLASKCIQVATRPLRLQRRQALLDMALRSHRSVRAASVEEKPVRNRVDMQERMEFLKKDLQHLFDNQGVDQSQYDKKVNFMDPITKYSSVQGYMFNIAMLKRVFAPTFQLHDIKQTGEYEVTTRWTMVMKPTINRLLPVRKWWDPSLIFTGVSIMGVNPENGKFNKHIDLWDALEPENQEYLSKEGVAHVFSQLTSLSRAPDLESPQFTLLKKKKQYEVRRYEPFVVAETDMQPSTSGREEKSPAGVGGSAFNTLAGYIFGKNKQQQKMKMTTPVFTDNLGKMRFVVTTSKDSLLEIPEPESENVKTKEEPGGYYAVSLFTGKADEATAQEKCEELRQALQGDRIQHDSSKCILARYNDPSTRPNFRRNEILIPIHEFDIWSS